MIPVVLIHRGESARYPLDMVIDQACRFNNPVTLIHDAHDAEVNIEDYWTRAAEFEPYYVHLSTNHVAFELFCFQRWFVLAEWMERNSEATVLYTDSDVLLYTDATQSFAPYADCGLTLALGTSPATAYFTLAGVRAFCDFVQRIYAGHGDELRELKRIFSEMRRQNLPGGVCDMTLFKMFKEQVHHVKVGEMTEIHDGATWDHNINVSDGFGMHEGIKRIIWDVSQRPYGWFGEKRIRFNALHFQNGAKRLMEEFAR